MNGRVSASADHAILKAAEEAVCADPRFVLRRCACVQSLAGEPLRHWLPSRCTDRLNRSVSTGPERRLHFGPLQALGACDGANIPVPSLLPFSDVDAIHRRFPLNPQ